MKDLMDRAREALLEGWDTVCYRSAWWVPRRLAYWCCVRVMAHASMVLPSREMNSITPSDILKSWSVGDEERV
jgi:hypothetical protein